MIFAVDDGRMIVIMEQIWSLLKEPKSELRQGEAFFGCATIGTDHLVGV